MIAASAGPVGPPTTPVVDAARGGRVVATPAELSALADRIAADRDALTSLRERTAWALAELRDASDEPGVQVMPERVDHRIELVARQVDEVRRATLETAAAVRGADRWAVPGWWHATTGALQWADAVAEVRPEMLPGLDGEPVPAAFAAARSTWAAARAWDAAGPRRFDRPLAAVAEAGRRRLSAVADAAARLWPQACVGSLRGRIADVLRAPAVRRAGRVLGRVGNGLGVAVDVVEGIERLVDGDGWGAVRSAASAAGGVAMVVGAPGTIAVGAAVVAGVFVYENRAAIAEGARRTWGAARAAAERAGSVAAEARSGVVDTGGAMLDGARRVLDGLF